MFVEEPTIFKGPEPFIVGFEEEKTIPPTFTCIVGGAPEPTLLWAYVPSLNIGEGLQVGKAELLLLDGEDYNISYSRTKELNGRFVVTSTVVFLTTMNTDGGIVRCKTGSEPGAKSADVLLTVLGVILQHAVTTVVYRKHAWVHALGAGTCIHKINMVSMTCVIYCTCCVYIVSSEYNE